MSRFPETATRPAPASHSPGGKLLASLCLAAAALAAPLAGAQTVIPVDEDVMTSSFFFAPNTVRGYASEANRPVLRTSTDGAYGLPGAETIYLTFDYDFASFSGPVDAKLTMQSTAGGQNADASPDNPFLVSVHALSANPLTTIVDDTNPGGTASWLNFYQNSILPADAAASTLITGFGAVEFDVSAAVNSWRTGDNTIFALAVTGLNETSDYGFLHGFLNNDNGGTAMGHTFLTVSAVPEPATLALALGGLVTVGGVARRRRQPRC